MKESGFHACKISDRVYWVGAIDWSIRDFHGYATSRGTTYNAYLVLGEKKTLIDTVKAPFKEEMLARIASVIEPSRIDYLISNHAEMDHSGCLPGMVEEVRPDKIYASAMGVKALEAQLHGGFDITAVKDGEECELGGVSFSFIETRMLHWPDSMMTFLPDEGVLFSQDGFGMHLASYERFDDRLPEAVLAEEAAKYYANILLPYCPVVKKTLEKLETSGIQPALIAPDHGPVWRRGVTDIVGRYARWAGQRSSMKAVIAYDTMWGSTGLMARAVGEGLARGGVSTKLMPLGSCHRSDVVSELLDAGALLIGSPTINNTLFPTVADLLCYLKGLKPRNLIGAVFGSYGWSGEAVKEVHEYMESMGVEIEVEDMRLKWVPDGEALSRCVAYGMRVAETLSERV